MQVQPQRPPGTASVLGDFQAGGRRGERAPAADILEVIEQDGLARRGGDSGRRFRRGGDG